MIQVTHHWTCDNRDCEKYRKNVTMLGKNPRGAKDSGTVGCPECGELLGVRSYSPFFTV